jgi:hypothetical protein
LVIAARIRDLAVPSGMCSRSAISWAVMPYAAAITTALACSDGRAASASRSWLEVSLARARCSGLSVELTRYGFHSVSSRFRSRGVGRRIRIASTARLWVMRASQTRTEPRRAS